jgi:outer membrane receptor protein involved in Fe transport
MNLYAYDFFALKPWLTLLAGVAWNRIDRPENFRQPPVSKRQVQSEKTSGKIGFTLTSSPALVVRGIYSEAMGGVTFDETVRLEPVQLAGFNQAFRTVISESLVGSVEAPVYKNLGLSVAGETPARTWWAASFNRLDEDVARVVGAFDLFNDEFFPTQTVVLPASTIETFAYREEVFAAGINQLIGKELSVGAGYRTTRAELRSRLPLVRVAVSRAADRLDTATLDEASLYGNWNSASGWFARAEANHFAQELNAGSGTAMVSPSGDRFWQINAQLGHRFHRNRHEVSGGVLNLTDRDYHLSPLTYTSELPHERMFFVRVRVSF